jgi:hypothetical protein
MSPKRMLTTITLHDVTSQSKNHTLDTWFAITYFEVVVYKDWYRLQRCTAVHN